MKLFTKNLWLLALLVVFFSCSEEYTNSAPFTDDTADNVDTPNVDDTNDDDNTASSEFAEIDFSNWKVTLPVDKNNNGSPDEYQPSQLIDGKYRTNAEIQPYMFDDTEDQSIVFYTTPDVSTANSKYSRTELRELIDVSNSRVNWSLETGGTMKGRLKMVEISEDNNSSNQYHRTIVMQIHGILSISDVNRLGVSSNNGPPLIKMTWIDGYIWAYKKSLVNENTSGDDLLDTTSDTWVDEKQKMGYVGFEPFDFRITASSGKLELQLNENAPLVYEDISMQKWPFENYFKAGNYLTTTDSNGFSKVKYYNLQVTH